MVQGNKSSKGGFDQDRAQSLLDKPGQLLNLARELLKNENWEGIGWMACSVEGCQALDISIKALYTEKQLPEKFTGHALTVLAVFINNSHREGLVKWFPDICLQKIMLDAKHYDYPGGDWVHLLKFQDERLRQKNLTLANRLLDEELIHQVCRRLKKEQVNDAVMNITGSILGNRAQLSAEDDVRDFDELVAQCPRIQRGIENYWGTDAWTKGDHSFGRFSHDMVRLRLDTTIVPRRDSLDMSMTLGRDWVVQAVVDKTDVGMEVISRLREGDELHWFLCDLSPSKALSVMPSLAKHLGADWRDTKGRNLAHALTIEANSIKRGALISLAAKPDMIHLFTTPDIKGETPLDWMGRLPGWNKHPDLISKIKRRVMNSFVKTPPKRQALASAQRL